MHVLILGGTSFVGRAFVSVALARGDTVTVFNRGTHAAPPGVEQLHGDRLKPNGHDALKGRTFDAVIDTWMDDASAVRDAITALRGNFKHFTYISSISVYDFAGLREQAKNAPPGTAPEPLQESSPLVDVETAWHPYAANKRAGEIAALEAGVPVLLIRPGLILGPHETPGRLPWWLSRLKKGGRTVAPGTPDTKLQYVDARDIAVFALEKAALGVADVFNMVSPSGYTTTGEILDIATELTGNKATLVWTPEEEILKADISGWTELPIWDSQRSYRFTHGSDVSKVMAAGLKLRPVRETVEDTWAWLESGKDPQATAATVGLSPEKEAKLLNRTEGTS